jgi:ribosomal protein L37E
MPSPKPHLKCDKCGKASYTKRCAKCMTADNKKAEESKKKKEYEYITVKGKRMKVEKKPKKKVVKKPVQKSKTFLYQGKKYSKEQIEAMRAKKPKTAPPAPPAPKKKKIIKKVVKKEEPKKKKIIKKVVKKAEPKKEAPKKKVVKIVKASKPSEPTINPDDSEAVKKEKKRRIARIRATVAKQEKEKKARIKKAQTTASLNPKQIIAKAKKNKSRLGKVQDFLLDVKMNAKDQSWFDNFGERLNEDEEDFDFDYSKLMRLKNKYLTQAKKKAGTEEAPKKKKKIIKKIVKKAPASSEPIDYLEDEHFLKGVGMPLTGPDITAEAWEESMKNLAFPPPPPPPAPATPKPAQADSGGEKKKKLIDSLNRDSKQAELFRKAHPGAKKKEQRAIYGKLRAIFNMLKDEAITEKEAREEEFKTTYPKPAPKTEEEREAKKEWEKDKLNKKDIDLFFYMLNNKMFIGADEYLKKRNAEAKAKAKFDEEFRQAQIKAGQRYE